MLAMVLVVAGRGSRSALPQGGVKPALLQYTEQTFELHPATAVHVHRLVRFEREGQTGREHVLTFRLKPLLLKQTTVCSAADNCLA